MPLPEKVQRAVGAEVLRPLARDGHVLGGDRADVVLGERVGVAGGEALDVLRLDVRDAEIGAPDLSLEHSFGLGSGREKQ